MSKTTFNVTRRQSLVGVGAVAVTPLALASVAAVAKTHQPDRRAWDKAMSGYKHYRALADAIADRLDKLEDAYQAVRGAVPHVSVGTSVSGEMSTANDFLVSMAKVTVKRPPLPDSQPEYKRHFEQSEKLLEAVERREAEFRAIDKRMGRSALNDKYEALRDKACEFEMELLNMPAPDGEALMWKVDNLYTPGDGIWGEGVEDQTYADLRRFLLTGRA
jgi:hypothetical protein